MVLFRRIRRNVLLSLAKALARVQVDVDAATLPRFANEPRNLTIQPPHRIHNPQHIFLGSSVKLGPSSVLSASEAYPGNWMKHPDGRHIEQRFEPVLRIGDRVTATSGLQVFALQEIIIEDDVMFASNVFISDATHGYGTALEPYKYQGMTQPQAIRIGVGSWIGQNVVVMPGVTIGECAIVGANSVVTQDIPSRAIALGNPAKVIKMWSDDLEEWQRVKG